MKNINEIFNEYQVWKKDSFIIVDQENDFNENWSLAVNWAKEIIKPTVQTIDYFKNRAAIVVASKDAHDEWHVSFASSYKNKDIFTNVTYDEVQKWTDNDLTDIAKFNIEELKAYLKKVNKQELWPDHCVKWTEWMEFVKWILEVVQKIDDIFYKWTTPMWDAYSSFEWKNDKQELLADYLRKKWVERNFVWWLATDFCDKATAIDSVKNGFDTYFVKDLARAVNINPNDENLAIEEMQDNWVKIIK